MRITVSPITTHQITINASSNEMGLAIAEVMAYITRNQLKLVSIEPSKWDTGIMRVIAEQYNITTQIAPEIQGSGYDAFCA